MIFEIIDKCFDLFDSTLEGFFNIFDNVFDLFEDYFIEISIFTVVAVIVGIIVSTIMLTDDLTNEEIMAEADKLISANKTVTHLTCEVDDNIINYRIKKPDGEIIKVKAPLSYPIENFEGVLSVQSCTNSNCSKWATVNIFKDAYNVIQIEWIAPPDEPNKTMAWE